MKLKRLRNPKGKNFSKYHESKAKKMPPLFHEIETAPLYQSFFQNINLTSTVKNQKQNK